MWFFSSQEDDGEDDGCGGHHFGEWEPTGELKLEKVECRWGESDDRWLLPSYKIANYVASRQFYRIREKRKRTCQHSRCKEEQETFVQSELVAIEDFADFLEDYETPVPDCVEDEQ